MLNHSTPLEIHVTILDDIPVEAISSLNAAIFSVHFHFQFLTGINVSCCNDENGNKLFGNTTSALESGDCAECLDKIDGPANDGSTIPLLHLNVICLLRIIAIHLLFDGH